MLIVEMMDSKSFLETTQRGNNKYANDAGNNIDDVCTIANRNARDHPGFYNLTDFMTN